MGRLEVGLISSSAVSPYNFILVGGLALGMLFFCRMY